MKSLVRSKIRADSGSCYDRKKSYLFFIYMLNAYKSVGERLFGYMKRNKIMRKDLIKMLLKKYPEKYSKNVYLYDRIRLLADPRYKVENELLLDIEKVLKCKLFFRAK